MEYVGAVEATRWSLASLNPGRLLEMYVGRSVPPAQANAFAKATAQTLADARPGAVQICCGL
eukprot:8546742-Alexandrium_andersonii.AAC.1